MEELPVCGARFPLETMPWTGLRTVASSVPVHSLLFPHSSWENICCYASPSTTTPIRTRSTNPIDLRVLRVFRHAWASRLIESIVSILSSGTVKRSCAVQSFLLARAEQMACRSERQPTPEPDQCLCDSRSKKGPAPKED